MRIACEEVFGPVLVVIPYDTVDEAIAIANSTPFGLQGAVFTRSLEVAFKAAHGIRTGAVFVNRSSNFRLDHLPFGGLRESGTTREGGRYTIEGMSQVKLVLVDATMTGPARTRCPAARPSRRAPPAARSGPPAGSARGPRSGRPRARTCRTAA